MQHVEEARQQLPLIDPTETQVSWRKAQTIEHAACKVVVSLTTLHTRNPTRNLTFGSLSSAHTSGTSSTPGKALRRTCV